MSKSDSEVAVSREAVPAPIVPCDLVAARSGLFGLALRITGNRHDAEDVLQSAFVRALQHWGGLPRPIEHEVNWSAWLRTLVRRLAVDELRRKRRARGAACDPESLAAQPGEPIATWRSITEEQLTATLATCPPALRTIYELHHERGMSYRCIGDALNIPLRTVASRLHRARAFIRQRLGLGVFADQGTEEITLCAS
jgi:RNA polymerase sigma factor (sigma-70 family)